MHVSELLADELFPVVSDLSRMPMRPDIIHRQQHMEPMAALLALTDVSALCFIYGIVPWQESVAMHPRILSYINLGQNAAKQVILEKNLARLRSAVESFRSHGPFHRWFTRKLDRSIRNFLKSKK